MSRRAIVAGGACATGLASALRFAELGFDVALVGTGLAGTDLADTDVAATASTVQRIAGTGQRCVALEADVADSASFAAALDQARTALGSFSVLLNCVPLGPPGPVSDEARYDEARYDEARYDQARYDEERYDEERRSLRALFVCSRAVCAHMARGRWGRIVNVAQPAGAGDRWWRDSQTVLAGLVGFTRSAALELAAYGVTANYIAPSACYPGGPARAPAPPRTSPGRGDSPSYAAGVAATTEFLISDQAAAITGQGGYLAGGFSSQPQDKAAA